METLPIPGPPSLPFIGNLADIDTKDLSMSISKLADKYGDIFKLNLGGINRIVITSQELMDEICDEKRFTKVVGGGVRALRPAVNDGLFTATMEEHNWGVAHRTLMPALGPLSTSDMFDEMHDIASQLVSKLARFGPTEKIDANKEFTRLTLDTLALCAMDKRFNSFYREDMHPFVDVMTDVLTESQARGNRPAFANIFNRAASKKYFEDIAYMRKTAEEMLAFRRANPTDKKDLLNAMIKGKDPKLGCGMTDESIIDNMITFLIAGHETTSGLLAFVFYNFLKHPDAMKSARDEVDEVLGRGPITVQHLRSLKYIEAALRETLRIFPTAPAIAIHPVLSTTEYPVFLAGGKYKLEKGDVLLALLTKLHKDPRVYGDDAEEWKPERMLDENFNKLPPNSWKPFGNGARGCIGRPFAMQEAILATALLLQNFNFRFDDPSYELVIQQSLTIKPKDFCMRAELRDGIDSINIEKQLHGNVKSGKKAEIATVKPTIVANGKAKEPMTILYGSNSGTCEALSQSLARVAGSRGFEVKVDSLDSAVNNVPKNQPVVIICPSYEGKPPDNAIQFFAWIEGLESDLALDQVNFAVFGVGNHDWTTTFHKIPTRIDQLFEGKGATRIAALGLGDVGNGDIFNDFDTWQDSTLWPAVQGSENVEVVSGTDIDLDIDSSARSGTLRQDLQEATILSNQLLTSAGQPEKRHIELQLPEGVEYKAGDYLAVLPTNSQSSIRRVLKRFKLPSDAVITIKGANSGSTLPTSHPISVTDLLGSYVELNQPASKRNIQAIAAATSDKTTRQQLLDLVSSSLSADVNLKRRSLITILESYPQITLPFSSYLSMLPPMHIRQYSISSSPLASSTTLSITFSVLSAPDFQGVATNYLSSLAPGERIHIAVKPTHKFHLPSNVEETPLIMACAGSGLAPFRGFVQERAEQLILNPTRKLAPAYLFIGCKHPDHDVLFPKELQNWEKSGVVKVFYAFSRASERSNGHKYVQDRLLAEREEISGVFRKAKFLVCGSSGVGDGVKEAIKKIYVELSGEKKTDSEIEAWFEELKRQDRFAMDVFD